MPPNVSRLTPPDKTLEGRGEGQSESAHMTLRCEDRVPLEPGFPHGLDQPGGRVDVVGKTVDHIPIEEKPLNHPQCIPIQMMYHRPGFHLLHRLGDLADDQGRDWCVLGKTVDFEELAGIIDQHSVPPGPGNPAQPL